MASGSTRLTQATGIGGTIANMLAGTDFEFMDAATRVEIALTKSAAPAGVAVADIQFGSRVLMNAGLIATEQGVGFGPILPDNIVVAGFALGGDRLRVQARETGGVADANVTLFIRTEDV